MARLAEKFNSEIRGSLKEKFKLNNIFEVPRIEKIVIQELALRKIFQSKKELNL